MEIRIIKKKYRVWFRIDGVKRCNEVEALSGKNAKEIVKQLYPVAMVSNAILVEK